MKKLLALLFSLTMLVFAISCGDDDDDTPAAPSFSDPTVSAGAVSDVNVGGSGTASFTVSVDSDLTANYSASSTGGITLGSTSGSVSGSTVDITFDATTAGAASVTLTVTDSEGQSANATAVFNVLAEDDNIPSISGIPSTATIAQGSTLSVPGVTFEAADGLGTLTVTVNGAEVADLGADLSASGTSATVDFSAPQTATFAPGNYTIVFTLTDADGDVATVTHVLTVEAAPIVEIFASDAGTGTTTWTSENVYVLRGFVFVNEGQTLTIEPGTIIKGQPGEGAGASALIVARGGTINAVGTADAPIIFTALTDDISPADIAAGNFGSPNLEPTENGRWGGLIVLGNAPISAANDNDEDISEAQIEGIPSTEVRGLYGGSDDADNSGTISYVSVRHGGSLIGAGNEINGVTLGGVGSGTTISNIEVVANADDGVEWFGGNVNVTNLLVWNSFDDALDTDQDWIGTCENYIVVTPRGGSAFELDGPEGTLNRGFHTFSNGTVYAGPDIFRIVDWDGSTNAGIDNLYVFGIEADYVDGIESFGGDGSGTTANWEATIPAGATVSAIFNGGADAIVTEVAANANTVGADASVFGWTWAAQSGALAGIGLQ